MINHFQPRAWPVWLMIGFSFAPIIMLSHDFVAHLSSKQTLPDLWDLDITTALWNSVFLSTTVAFCALAFALCIAIGLLSKKHKILHGVVLLSLCLHFLLSPIVTSVGWTEVPLFKLMSPLWQVVVMLSLKYVALALFMLRLALCQLNSTAIEAGQCITTPLRVARHLILPQLLPTLLLVFIVIFFLTLMEAEVTSLFGYHTLAEDFFSRIVLQNNPGVLFWLALPQLSAILVVLLFLHVLWPSKSLLQHWENKATSACQSLVQPAMACRISLCTLLISLPPLVLIVIPFFRSELHLLHRSQDLQAFANGCVLNGTSVLLTTLAAISLSDRVLESTRTQQKTFFILFGLIALLPGALYAVGAVALAQSTLIYPLLSGNNLFMLTQGFRWLPYGVFLLCGLHWLDNNRNRAENALLGIHGWGRWRFLRAPVEWPRWLLVFCVLLSLSLADLSSTVLTIAPGTETVVLRLYNLLHYGAGETAALLSLSQAVLILPAFWFSWHRLQHRTIA